MTILDQSTPHGLGVRVPALQLLLAAQPENKPELAKLASPVDHVDGTCSKNSTAVLSSRLIGYSESRQ